MVVVLLLCLQDVIDVIVTKTVNRVSAVIGQGDNPTFDFTVTLTAAAGSVVVNPTVIDSISSTGLELLGAVQPSGEPCLTEVQCHAYIMSQCVLQLGCSCRTFSSGW